MHHKKRVLVCEFFQETDTFNPILTAHDSFQRFRSLEGQDAYDACKKLRCAASGMMNAIEDQNGVVIPAMFLFTHAGGRVDKQVVELFYDRMQHYLDTVGSVDAICASLHGATCAEGDDDVCGAFLTYLRERVGEDIKIAVSFDMHANVTDKILQHADVICGHQTYPHVDGYETGYRAGTLCMQMLAGKTISLAAVKVPILIPPSGYSNLEEPFKQVIDSGLRLVKDGTLLDFTVFCSQPWLDVPQVGSCAIAIAEDSATAKQQADMLAKKFFEHRDGYWPDLMSIDEIIDRAEVNDTGTPVLLVDFADSPNGGAVGDSVAVAMRLQERGTKLRSAMFVMDPETVVQAFSVGVGNKAEFFVGGKFTPNAPGPLHATGKVRSLHDGNVVREGPVGKGGKFSVGKAAVISFGSMDIMVCEAPAVPGDPQIFRHFGIEPKLYDLVVVKANASFRVPYSKITSEIYYADTPGACAANLNRFQWKNRPAELYPFDLPADYQLAPAKIWR